MIKAVRAIIINDNNLLVMKRNKFGKKYYTLIGGHVEMNESKEKALLREIHEETKIHVSNPRLVFIEHTAAPYGDQYVYLVDYISGTPILHELSDEKFINQGGDNTYTPMWLPISKLSATTFRTENIKKRIIDGVKNGFPVQVEEFSSTVE